MMQVEQAKSQGRSNTRYFKTKAKQKEEEETGSPGTGRALHVATHAQGLRC
jgi:hypothetical protein